MSETKHVLATMTDEQWKRLELSNRCPSYREDDTAFTKRYRKVLRYLMARSYRKDGEFFSAFNDAPTFAMRKALFPRIEDGLKGHALHLEPTLSE